VPHLALAEGWLALGEKERARHHAESAYRAAWGVGELYVFRWALSAAANVLKRRAISDALPR
jgi:hypothetical protein